MFSVDHLVGFAGDEVIGIPSLVVSATFAANVSSKAYTTTADIKAGSLVVIAHALNSTNSVTVSSISDGTNTYTKATSATSTLTDNEIWYKSNAAFVASGGSITVTFSATTGNAADGGGIIAAQVSGVVPISAIDQVGTNTSTSGATLTVTVPAIGSAKEIIFGAGASSGSTTYNPSAGYANVTSNQTGNVLLGMDYVVAPAAINYVAGWSGGTPARNIALAATFKGF
jgi:hypothetical protein